MSIIFEKIGNFPILTKVRSWSHILLFTEKVIKVNKSSP